MATKLEEAAEKLNAATAQWNETVKLYDEARIKLRHAQNDSDKCDRQWQQVSCRGTHDRLVQSYYNIAECMDELRDISSDLTFALGEMSNAQRNWAKVYDEEVTS